jgi:poly(3-hydroxyalkanoate) depolymerase
MRADTPSSSPSGSPTPDIVARMVGIGRQHLHVAVRAGRQPPLLLCNGIGANLELFAPVMRALDGVETVAFDVPGTGSSPPSPEPMRLRGVAQLVAMMCARLGYQQIDVLGVSWGGLLAQQLAGQYPERVRRLVLVSTGAGATPETLRISPGALRTMFHLASPRRWHDVNYMQEIAPEVYGGVFRADPGRVRETFSGTKQPSFLGYYGQVVAMLGWSSLAWLHRLPQPTLVISGTDDPLVPVASARQLAERIPNARLRLFDDGHLVLMTRLDEIAPLVRDFVMDDNLASDSQRQSH